jgi:hypothetical protein
MKICSRMWENINKNPLPNSKIMLIIQSVYQNQHANADVT